MPAFSRLFALLVRDCLPEGSEWMELQLNSGLDLTQEAPDLPHLHVPNGGGQKVDDPVDEVPPLPGLLPSPLTLFCQCRHLLSPPFLSIHDNL